MSKVVTGVDGNLENTLIFSKDDILGINGIGGDKDKLINTLDGMLLMFTPGLKEVDNQAYFNYMLQHSGLAILNVVRCQESILMATQPVFVEQLKLLERCSKDVPNSRFDGLRIDGSRVMASAIVLNVIGQSVKKPRHLVLMSTKR